MKEKTELVYIGPHNELRVLESTDKLGKVRWEVIPARFSVARARALFEYTHKVTLKQWCEIFKLSNDKCGVRKAKAQLRLTMAKARNQGEYIRPIYNPRDRDPDGKPRHNARIIGAMKINLMLTDPKEQAKQMPLIAAHVARLEEMIGRMLGVEELVKEFKKLLPGLEIPEAEGPNGD